MLIGIDTGGTFTDFVGRTADGRAMVLKVQSTPDDPSRAMLEGINQLLSELKVSQLRLCAAQRSQPTRSLSEKAPAPASSLLKASGRSGIDVDTHRVYELQLQPRHKYFRAGLTARGSQ